MKSIVSYLLLLMLPFIAKAQTEITLRQISGKLSSPVVAAFPKDASGRLFVGEQHGIIKIVSRNGIQPEPFLDIQHKVIRQLNVYSERGLLGLAFHPDYKSNHKFYVYYSAKSNASGSNHKSVVAEYTARGNQAQANTERIILEIEEPQSNHNGGHLVFGPDRYLYIGVGDGGGANDEHGPTGNGQRLDNLLGKILRIDVNTEKAYRIPPDNPFIGKGRRGEIWAYGLRNPWKFEFDEKGRLFCADVGQDEYEEINLIEKGKNYGWRIMEGNHCFNPSKNCKTTGLTLPIHEYNHNIGKCIIGGFVYRGNKLNWKGKYFFADWTGKLFVLSASNRKWISQELQIRNLPGGGLYINSMGENEAGELFLLGQEGIGPSKAALLYQIELP
ncbi:MAG: PQQ-dependent sugar dehydrogenase [Bacteroidia bacterium]|jgi:glucose/arabinose dehydrogenase